MNLEFMRRYEGTPGYVTASGALAAGDGALYQFAYEGMGNKVSVTQGLLIKSDYTGYAGRVQESNLSGSFSNLTFGVTDHTSDVNTSTDSDEKASSALTNLAFARSVADICTDVVVELPELKTLRFAPASRRRSMCSRPRRWATISSVGTRLRVAAALHTGPSYTVSPSSTTTYYVGIKEQSDRRHAPRPHAGHGARQNRHTGQTGGCHVARFGVHRRWRAAGSISPRPPLGNLTPGTILPAAARPSAVASTWPSTRP